MEAISYKTISANSKTATKNWVIVDAENQILGRLSSHVAAMIRGKNKTNFTPHVDCGDNVIVLNAAKVKLTGNKWDEKLYRHHTGYVKGVRTRTAKEMLEKIADDEQFGERVRQLLALTRP